MRRRAFLALLPAATLAGCGFKLRRIDALPFASVYVDAPPDSAVAQRIRDALADTKSVGVAGAAPDAEAVLKLEHEVRTKAILSLSGAGRVTEYRLGLQLSYSVSGPDGRQWAVPETIELVRDMTYDDAQVLAKGAEEQLLYRDMEETAALRILRRLQDIPPGGVAADAP